MKTKKNKKKARTTETLKVLLAPLVQQVDQINTILKKKRLPVKYYRNEDLKQIFGLSSNTIIKYRQCGIIPYTRLGDIYLYDAARLHEILKENEV